MLRSTWRRRALKSLKSLRDVIYRNCILFFVRFCNPSIFVVLRRSQYLQSLIYGMAQNGTRTTHTLCLFLYWSVTFSCCSIFQFQKVLAVASTTSSLQVFVQCHFWSGLLGQSNHGSTLALLPCPLSQEETSLYMKQDEGRTVDYLTVITWVYVLRSQSASITCFEIIRITLYTVAKEECVGTFQMMYQFCAYLQWDALYVIGTSASEQRRLV